MSRASDDPHLLLLSAPDRAGLLAALDRLSVRLAAGLAPDPRCRPGEPERLAIISPPGGLAEQVGLARRKLADLRRPRLILRDKGIHFGCGDGPGRVAFLFAGEGGQRVGMLREARDRLGPVRDWLGALDAAYGRAGETGPVRLIHPAAGLDAAERRGLERTLFDIAHGAQLGTVINLGLAEMLVRLGLRPDVVLGHSNGEHAAIMTACMEPTAERDAICDWLRRTSLAGQALGLPPIAQRMAAVGGLDPVGLDAVLAAFPNGLYLAMDNCPHQQVVGGTKAVVEAAAELIAARGGVCGILPFERAYHTPLFAPWSEMLARRYRELPLGTARLPVYSCLTGALVGPEPAALREAMVRQWTAPVDLRRAVLAMYDDGVRTFIEIGSDSKLSAFVEDTLRGRPHLAVAMMSSQRGDMEQLRQMLAALHAQGLGVDAAALQPPPQAPTQAGSAAAAVQARLIADAHAAMARVEQAMRPVAAGPAPTPAGALLGDDVRFDGGVLLAERRLCRVADPFLADHCLGRPPGEPLAVVSFTTSLALAAEAARRLTGAKGRLVLSDVSAGQWLALDGGRLTLRVRAEPSGAGAAVALFGEDAAPAFTARVDFGGRASMPCFPDAIRDGRAPRFWTAEAFYRDYAFHGPCFQGLRRVIAVGPEGIEAEAVVTRLPALDAKDLEADPALLDCAGQVVALWLLEQHGVPPSLGVFPYAARRVTLFGTAPVGAIVRCRASVAWHDGIRTEANIVFTADGRPLASIEGLEQRVVHLPPALASWVFGRRDGLLSQPAGDGTRWLDREVWRAELAAQGGIWGRALAHLMLEPAERDRWLVRRDLPSLLDHIATREAAQVGGEA